MESSTQLLARRQLLFRRQAALIATATTALLLIALEIAGLRISPLNAGLIYLLLCIQVAAAHGFKAGCLTATVSMVGVNYFFLEPIFAFTMGDLQHIAAVPVFYIAAGIGASFHPSKREEADSALPEAESSEAKVTDEAIKAPSLRLDAERALVFLDGSEIRLTPTEFSLLEFLVANPGRVLRPQAILKSVWGDQYAGDVHILRTYINQLRAKLHDNASTPRFIRTDPGFGYRFLNPGE